MIKLFMTVLLLFAPAAVWSQAKPVAPPAESAPAAEQQNWLVQAIAKYGSYKAAATSVKISDSKIAGCSLSFLQTKSSDTSSEQTLIRRTRTDSIKDNVVIDFAKLDITSLKLSEYLSPEVMSLTFRVRRDNNTFKDFEIILREPAAEAIKTTFERVAKGCQASN